MLNRVKRPHIYTEMLGEGGDDDVTVWVMMILHPAPF